MAVRLKMEQANFEIDEELFINALFDDDFNLDQKTDSKPEISGGRFAPPTTAADIEKKHKEAIPKKTRQNNGWATTLWRDWAVARNGQFETCIEPGWPIPEDIGAFQDNQQLEYWMQRFIIEIRRKDGEPYPPNTLIQVVSGLQRYLVNDCKKHEINFLKTGSREFVEFRKTLDSRMKELTQAGIGVYKNRADPVTEADENTLWSSGVFNKDTAEGLSNIVFFYNGKAFGFRGFQEHQDCQAEQFEIGYDHTNKRKFIKFTPRVRKNLQGGLVHRKIDVEPIIHYEQESNDRSLVKIYGQYLDLVPRKGPFYRKPLNGVDENNNLRYSSASVPQNALKQRMKKFFKDANISTEGRRITNHSARVSLCTSLYNEKLSDKAVTSRSKHRSSAVKTYQRENFNLLSDISNILDPPTDKSLDSKPCPESVETKPCTVSNAPPVETVENIKREIEEDETLTLHLPKSVKKIVIWKDGRNIAINI